MQTEEFECGYGERRVRCRMVAPDDQRLSPQPALLLSFAAARETTLGTYPYRLAAQIFVEAGHRVVSFDLPNHGERVDQYGEGIEGMCAAFLAGADPFERFVTDGSAVIDACLARGVGTPGRIVACGVSRAGYCALRLAAADPRVQAVAGFAPVTDWRRLSEFDAVRERPEVAALALETWTSALVARPIFLAIGNQDSRVGTDSCVRLALGLLQAGAPVLQLHVTDVPGHTMADEWYAAGVHFLLRQLTNTI